MLSLYAFTLRPSTYVPLSFEIFAAIFKGASNMHTIQENKPLYRTTSSPAARNIRKISNPSTSLLVDVVEVWRAVCGQTFVVELPPLSFLRYILFVVVITDER